MYKSGQVLELGTTKNKFSKWSEQDSNAGPSDFESNALTTQSCCLVTVQALLKQSLLIVLTYP